jgi:hypothetical protein
MPNLTNKQVAEIKKAILRYQKELLKLSKTP